MTKLRVMECFAGIGALSKALERLGIEHEIVDAVEIDKYAIKSFNAIHNTNFEPQDICQWDKDIEIDLLMHGSPCQDFSLAGKQAGGDEGSGTRSSLMYETIRIVEKLKPKYVIWENVKNLLSKKHIHNFNAYLETMEKLGYTNYYQILNAKDYGIPQNRERVFTISILGNESYEFPKVEENTNKINRLFNFSARQDCRVVYDENGLCPTLVAGMGAGGGKVPMFIDKGFAFPTKQELKLKLKDMLEDKVDEKYYLKKTNNLVFTETRASWDNSGKGYGSQQDRAYYQDGLCPTLSSCNANGDKSQVVLQEKNICINSVIKVGNVNPSGKGMGGQVVSEEGLARTITIEKGEGQKVMVKEKPEVIGGIGGKKSNGGTQWYQQDRIYDNNIGLSLSTTAQPYYPDNQLKIRKLTPKECFRLMGFDDADYEKAAKVNSNSQLYKQAGNSIVVNVLEAILTNLLLEQDQEIKGQMSIYDLN